MGTGLNRIFDRWDKWRDKNKVSSRLLAIAAWLLTAIPPLLSLQMRWLVKLLPAVGFLILIAFFIGDYGVAKKKGFRFFWVPWILAFLFSVTVTIQQIVWQAYKRDAENREIAWKTQQTQKDETIRILREETELTSIEMANWQKASDAFERGKIYRGEQNWVECAKAFEEAYIDTFPIALNHPERCRGVGHFANVLILPYEKLGRRNEAAEAASVQLVLENLITTNFTFYPSSPAIKSAVDLYNKLRK